MSERAREGERARDMTNFWHILFITIVFCGSLLFAPTYLFFVCFNCFSLLVGDYNSKLFCVRNQKCLNIFYTSRRRRADFCVRPAAKSKKYYSFTVIIGSGQLQLPERYWTCCKRDVKRVWWILLATLWRNKRTNVWQHCCSYIFVYDVLLFIGL